jgi:hypothetical protein
MHSAGYEGKLHPGSTVDPGWKGVEQEEGKEGEEGEQEEGERWEGRLRSA